MAIQTKYWREPSGAEDGYRLLICRSRPRAKAKVKQAWDGWCGSLGPSVALEADYRGTKAPSITPEEYRGRYLKEMEGQKELIDELARMALEGKTITLLCASACEVEESCHRALLKTLIEARMSFLEKIKN